MWNLSLWKFARWNSPRCPPTRLTEFLFSIRVYDTIPWDRYPPDLFLYTSHDSRHKERTCLEVALFLFCDFLRLLQYDVLRAAEDYEHEKLAQETQAQREKKEAAAEKNREKRELTRMRKEENRTPEVLKKEGQKVAKRPRKVESKEAKEARQKAKAAKAKKDAHAARQKQRRRKGYILKLHTT